MVEDRSSDYRYEKKLNKRFSRARQDGKVRKECVVLYFKIPTVEIIFSLKYSLD